MEHLLHDTNFWVLVSFVIFAVVAVKLGKAAFINLLDKHIASVRQEIESAENLRVEAQELMAQYQRKYNDAVSEAEEIIKSAQERADEIRKNAEHEALEMTKTREHALQERLSRIEENAYSEIIKEATEIAISTSIDLIYKKLNAKEDAKLIDNTIKTVSEKLH